MATIVSSQSMSTTERENSRIVCVVMPIPTSNASTPDAAVTPMTTTTRSLAVAYIQYRPYRPKAMKIIGFRTRAITRKGTHSGRFVGEEPVEAKQECATRREENQRQVDQEDVAISHRLSIAGPLRRENRMAAALSEFPGRRSFAYCATTSPSPRRPSCG